MNNNILTKDSCIYINDVQFKYIETNNNIPNRPYVFKLNNGQHSLKPYRYTSTISNNGNNILCWDSSNDGSETNAAAYCNVKAYGVATINEAATIGGTTVSDSSQLIKYTNIGTYNCVIKDNPTITYTRNRCVNYIDLLQVPTYICYIDILQHTSSQWSASEPIWKLFTVNASWGDNNIPAVIGNKINLRLDISNNGSNLGTIEPTLYSAYNWIGIINNILLTINGLNRRSNDLKCSWVTTYTDTKHSGDNVTVSYSGNVSPICASIYLTTNSVDDGIGINNDLDTTNYIYRSTILDSNIIINETKKDLSTGNNLTFITTIYREYEARHGAGHNGSEIKGTDITPSGGGGLTPGEPAISDPIG